MYDIVLLISKIKIHLIVRFAGYDKNISSNIGGLVNGDIKNS